MVAIEERVFIAGAGPVGMTAAARLVGSGVPVTVFEGGDDLSTESRASTFHPSTLDMLEDLGATQGLERHGLRARYLQYRSKSEGILARFDFDEIADLTRHPYRLQCEQWRLTRVLYDLLKDDPNFELLFGHSVEGCAQDHDGVTVNARAVDKTMSRKARFLIGADGASSKVRAALGIEFEGFTWPDRFLVLSTPFDFSEQIPDLDIVSYVADPKQWHFFLKIPGLWRVMLPISAEMPDDAALDEAYGRRCLDGVLAGAGGAEIRHRTLYRVHQRVAKTFRDKRAFLVGDAAHINNPLGGMGMNGGIHDAVNLTGLLAKVWNGQIDIEQLGLYDRQRRTVTLDAVQKQTIQNKKDLEAASAADQADFRSRLHRALATEDGTRAYLERLAMLASLKQAAAIT
ncbi:MAG: hypothetical protein CMM59_21490 [Rhodospirillaceae bacterium]|nr:hypothetical protein [Rhodospirillaceae bacterium]